MDKMMITAAINEGTTEEQYPHVPYGVDEVVKDAVVQDFCSVAPDRLIGVGVMPRSGIYDLELNAVLVQKSRRKPRRQRTARRPPLR